MTITAATAASALDYDSEDRALEEFHRRGWTDGLPVVLPTPERVEQMLLWSQGLDPDVVLGLMGPGLGEATVAKIAINAVMAGCRPEHFPVVLAATEAILAPEFFLGPVQETTHCVTPLIVINGPVRNDLGFASGTGVLGPGHRANAAVGRALRLIMMNVGGGHVGVGDMAIYGTPAKFSMCVAEAEELSPFEPLHVARGFAREDSTVTVVPVEGPHVVASLVDGQDLVASSERLIRSIGAGLAAPTSLSVYLGQGCVAAFVNPDHAQMLAQVGMSRDDVLQAIWEQAALTRGELRDRNPPMMPPAAGDDDVLNHAVTVPERIIFVVCGAPGDYAVAMPTWGAPTDLALAVTRKIRDAPVCEV